MRDAIKPNLLQTLENTPVIVHAGPFGNIAHGNSSIVADLIGIHAGDYLITEAGFGADMGAERFFNIKCRASGLVPDAAVLVATVRALKAHSGKYKIVAGQDASRRPAASRTPTTCDAGAANLRKQIENVKAHGVIPVVAINGFPTDHDSEHAAIRRVAEEMGRGSRCARTSPTAARAPPTWRTRWSRRATSRAGSTSCTPTTRRSRTRSRPSPPTSTAPSASSTHRPPTGSSPTTTDNGFGHLPVCIAKTHLSISGDASLKGAPTGHTLSVREVRASVGAGFVYPICGEMRTMPGLGGHPAAAIIDFDENGEIVGLS